MAKFISKSKKGKRKRNNNTDKKNEVDEEELKEVSTEETEEKINEEETTMGNFMASEQHQSSISSKEPSVIVLLQEISELKNLIMSLSRKIDAVEASNQDQQAMIGKLLAERESYHGNVAADDSSSKGRVLADGDLFPRNVLDCETSPMTEKKLKYAEVLKKPAVEEKRIPEVKRPNDVKTVRDATNRPLSRDVNENARSNSPRHSLPRVLVLHDSTEKGVDFHRLGLSYGLMLGARMVYKTEECEKVVERCKEDFSPDPDCVVLHFGINNLKAADPDKCSSAMAGCVKKVRSVYPRAKIVVSQPTPVRYYKLDTKRELFCAMTKAELVGEKDVSFLSNNLPTSYKMLSGDDIHPTAAGASVLAGKLGRHLHHLFWERPRRRQPFHPLPFRPAGSFGFQHPRRFNFPNRNYWAFPHPFSTP